jgi:hypothetical protein
MVFSERVFGRSSGYRRRVNVPEHPSGRRLAAIVLILIIILIWAVLVATLAPWVGQLPILVQALFYLIMGIGWIVPLKPLIRWSQTGSFRDRSKPER